DAPGRPLPLLYMLGLDDPPTWRAAVFLLKARAGGFMIAAPHLEGIISFFAAISEEAEGQVDGPLPVVWKVVSVACETSRRRRVGEVSMVLADLSWAHLVYFRRATASRPPAGAALLALTHEETAVRPMPGPAREAADEWVTEQLSDATFLEYATAEELQEDFLEDAEPPEEEDTVESLRARIRQMESAQGAMRAPQPPSHGPRQTRPLLEAVPEAGATLSAEDWQKLRAVAGSPPTRLAGHERAPRATAADNALAEEELEVSEMAPATSTDGDPITAAVSSGSGGDNVPGSSYVTKGIAAREAFLNVFDHPAEFAEGVARRAQQELGLSTQEPGLMRMYAERKIPMKELKTVQIFTHFLAHQWEAYVDYLESRMKQSRPSGHQDAPPDKSDDPEDKQPNKPRRPPRRAKAIADKPGDKSEK
ncbi:unnamed protein product, partial [Symbiodinium pilosum]